jgi:integrase/recombinase XerD
LKFAAFLRDEKEQAPRSVHNKFENVMSFLKAQKVRGLVGKNDWPRYTEEEPEVYERAEPDTWFAACDAKDCGACAGHRADYPSPSKLPML